MRKVIYFCTFALFVFLTIAKVSAYTEPFKYNESMKYGVITSLDATDISFISKYKDIENLDLSQAKIKDLAPLKDLINLKTLNLSNNQIEDISPLKGLKNLETLRLNNNNIIDIQFLKDISKLKNLDLSNNKIKSIEQLSNLKSLDNLKLNDNAISDLSPIKQLNKLSGLTIAGNVGAGKDIINDLKSGNSQLIIYDADKAIYNASQKGADPKDSQILAFDYELGYAIKKEIYGSNSNNPITLGMMKNLRQLTIDSVQLKDLKGLEYATNLEKLTVFAGQPIDFTPISNLKKLKSLDISSNDLTDIRFLKTLNLLEELKLIRNHLTDVSDLSNLKSLKTLYLNYNRVSDLNNITNLLNLEYLDVSHNKLSSLDSLSQLTKLKKLKELHLEYNNFEIDEKAQQFLSQSPFKVFMTSGDIVVSNDKKDEIKVLLNGNFVKFDVPPTVIEGRTLVPLRTIFESLGVKVNWDEDTRTVLATKSGVEIKFTIDSKTANVNGKKIELDVPAMIIDGRTLIPVRFVSENLGKEVIWDETENMVVIYDKGDSIAKNAENLTLLRAAAIKFYSDSVKNIYNASGQQFITTDDLAVLDNLVYKKYIDKIPNNPWGNSEFKYAVLSKDTGNKIGRQFIEGIYLTNGKECIDDYGRLIPIPEGFKLIEAVG